MIKILSLFSFLSLFSSLSQAESGFRITVEVKGLTEGDMMLGYHYGNSKFVLDTAKIVSPGNYLFQGSERLEPGVYILVFPGNTFFDLVIDKDQNFGIVTTVNDFLENTSFTNSPENTRFFQYLKDISSYRQQITSNNVEINDNTMDEDRRVQLVEENRSLNEKIRSSQDAYVNQFPDGLFSKILIAQREPDLPDPPEGLDEKEIRLFKYNQYKNRFWEHFDFSDQRLLRSPIYHARLNQFFGEVLVQNTDTLIAEADRMVDRARVNQDVFRYTVWFITNHFERSQIMGHDAVFVHMLERYYLSGEAFWVTEESRASLAERVSRMKPLLIGKLAPDINVFFANRQRISLHDVDAEYTILYFWDSNCGHCKRETPLLNGLYQRFRDRGVKVFAMNLDGDSQSWLNAVEEYGLQSWINVADPYNESGFREKYDVFATPIIYLLDRDKRIVAKRIDAQVLGRFMENRIGSRSEM